MPEHTPLTRARFIHMAADFKAAGNPAHEVEVQFNPETLKVTSSNQVEVKEQKGGGSTDTLSLGTFKGRGSSKLTMQLVFDVNAPPLSESGADDVRQATDQVRYFMIPQGPREGVFYPPPVRFAWGAFHFDGMMDGYDETLEMWSPDGRPLRATLSVGLTRPEVTVTRLSPPPGQGAGTRPLAVAAAGQSLQSLAERVGRGADWAGIATANGIENPRIVPPGALLDLGAGAGARVDVRIGT